MRTSLRLTLVAAAVLTPAAALADVVDFYSSSASTTYSTYYQGSPNTPPTVGTISNYYKPGSQLPTYDLTVSKGDTTWAQPYSGSSWVSFDSRTGPESNNPGGYVAPNGYYSYATSFTLDSAPSYLMGSINLLADDTVSVFLRNANGTVEIVPQYSGTDYSHCAKGTPNCIQTFSATFGGFASGKNTLIFVVDQANSSYTGLDYSGTVLTPEPGSLMLLSTGLLSGAGAMMRRFRRSA